MKRLAVICEGPTEEGFVKGCLYVHLLERGVVVVPQLLQARDRQGAGGHVTMTRLVGHIRRIHRQFDHVTSLVDYYGFNEPGKLGKEDLEARIAAKARERLGAGYNPEHIIPYVQMYEFEALLFSDVQRFDLNESWGEAQRAALHRIRHEFATPEEINDSPQSAPSKRIARVLPGYDRQKALYGPLVAENIGLDVIRRECPGFNAWLMRLETLAAQ